MNDKETGLENFIERHRAEFDVFEPRPDLWDSLEQKLLVSVTGAAEQAPEKPAAVVPLQVMRRSDLAETEGLGARKETHAVFGRGSWWPRPRMVAAVGLLVLAGIGAVWSNKHRSPWGNAGGPPLVLVAPELTDASARLYFATPLGTTTAESQPRQLTTAVRRMETYYAAQIKEREGGLRQLEAETTGAGAPSADWQRELTSLDSTYRQLKLELYRNPEPDVVLEAMNRNLQIRLDILNQQTHSREQVQEYQAQPLLVADTRPTP